jgi:hypothetical protein
MFCLFHSPLSLSVASRMRTDRGDSDALFGAFPLICEVLSISSTILDDRDPVSNISPVSSRYVHRMTRVNNESRASDSFI